MLAVAISLGVAGALMGSFATAVAHRLPRGQNWVSDRSRCPACGDAIPARDNVPVVSWILLRGRCRSCGEPVSARYPLTEAGLAAAFVATFLFIGDDEVWELALGLTLCFVLALITLTDLDQRIIPNKVVLAGSVAAVGIVAVGDPSSLDSRAIAALVAGGIMFGIAIAYPRGMGMGDAKLVGMMGLFLGRAIAPATLIGFALGSIVGLVMMARMGAAARKSAIPFGPFLALGGILGLWVGEDIAQWYLDEFFQTD